MPSHAPSKNKLTCLCNCTSAGLYDLDILCRVCDCVCSHCQCEREQRKIWRFVPAFGDCLGKPASARVDRPDRQTWSYNGLILASLSSAMPWNNLSSDLLDGTSDTLRHALFCSRSPRSELVTHRNRLFDNNFIYRFSKLIWFCLWV